MQQAKPGAQSQKIQYTANTLQIELFKETKNGAVNHLWHTPRESALFLMFLSVELQDTTPLGEEQ